MMCQSQKWGRSPSSDRQTLGQWPQLWCFSLSKTMLLGGVGRAMAQTQVWQPDPGLVQCHGHQQYWWNGEHPTLPVGKQAEKHPKRLAEQGLAHGTSWHLAPRCCCSPLTVVGREAVCYKHQQWVFSMC